MDTTEPEDTPASSPESSRASSVRLSIPPSNYLTVPITRSGRSRTLQRPPSILTDAYESISVSLIPSPRNSAVPTSQETSTSPRTPRNSGDVFAFYPEPIFMSAYSPASPGSDRSEYSNPPARSYQIPSFAAMPGKRPSQAEKEQMISSLRSHRVNTLVELRRIEQAFATLGSPELSEPMTAAWSYYVNSHGLLTELRGLTKNYPFSSECVDEAKRRVYSDPQSNRSWNFCWLVLSKIQNDQLIPYYARYQASLPTMWGGRVPTAEGVDQLAGAFTAEWNWAINQMLRHWDQPPRR